MTRKDINPNYLRKLAKAKRATAQNWRRAKKPDAAACCTGYADALEEVADALEENANIA